MFIQKNLGSLIETLHRNKTEMKIDKKSTIIFKKPSALLKDQLLQSIIFLHQTLICKKISELLLLYLALKTITHSNEWIYEKHRNKIML